MNSLKTKYINYKEIIFQVILHVLVFLFYSFDQKNPEIKPFQFAFFANYAVAIFIINYILLGRYFYPKKYIQFALYVSAIIVLVIVMEEFFLEQIFFPDTRGRKFPGFLFTFIQILPVLTILSGFKFAWDALIKQRELEELKSAIKESELQFLTSQINPHFLFNNLNNLYSYAIENSPKTPTIILELSSVMRYMLYECKEKYVPLKKEIEQLENFTRLSELQIEERGTIKFHVDGNTAGYRIAPLILIVFIENAFKHSQSNQSENIYIEIDVIIFEDGILEFRCKNNYQSRTNNHQLPHGIGLENVKKRLRLLYPEAHELIIEDTGDYYKVYLSIKLKKFIT